VYLKRLTRLCASPGSSGGPLRRLRRRRPPPTTLRGALVRGLVLLGVAVGLGAAAAVGVALALDRTTAVGFYLVGALVLEAAFFVSASDMSTP
jgi:hypothetical protein